MRNPPAPFVAALSNSVLRTETAASVQSLSFGLDGGLEFNNNVNVNAVWRDKLLEYLDFLKRRGKLIDFANLYLQEFAEEPTVPPEVAKLREVFARYFARGADGRLTPSGEAYRLVNLGGEMPFIGRDDFCAELGKSLGKLRYAPVRILEGATRSGHSFLGSYLAEIARREEVFTFVAVDFLRDLPVGPGETIRDVHLADLLARRVSGLEKYQDAYRGRREDFKQSSFVQDLLAALGAAEEFYLFFFDHLRKAALEDSTLDLIVHLADKIGRGEVPGLIVAAGLELRPHDQIFGLDRYEARSLSKKDVAIYFNRLYEELTTPEAHRDHAQRREFVETAFSDIPAEYFAPELASNVAPIGAACRNLRRLFLGQHEDSADHSNDYYIPGE